MAQLLGDEVDRLLSEDATAGDLTPEALGLARRRGRIRFSARGTFTLAGVEIAAAMLERTGAAVALAVRPAIGSWRGTTF
jgi:nicotinate-nucleotide pyrophosphorylase